MAQDPKEVGVSVPVPNNTKINVHDLKQKPQKELEELIKKASQSKVGFVILNAPFKTRSTGSAS